MTYYYVENIDKNFIMGVYVIVDRFIYLLDCIFVIISQIDQNLV